MSAMIPPCIETSIALEQQCPLCRSKIRKEDLHPNLALASLIQELLVYCPNKELGCPEKIRLEARTYHLNVCMFAPSECSYAKYGCSFKGTNSTVQNHLLDCPFEKIKGYIKYNDLKIAHLESLLLQQSLEIQHLKNTANGKPFDTLSNVSDVIISPTEEELMSAETWPFGDIQCRRTIAEHRAGVTSLCYHGGILYSGAYDGTIKVSNAESGQIIRTLRGHNLSVWALAVHAPSNRFFSAGSDGSIQVWSTDLDITTSLSTLKNHSGKVYSLVINGDRLYSASSDRTVKVWDLQSLNCLATLSGHTDGVNSLNLSSPDRLISAASDRTIKVWDLSTAQCINTINDYDSEVLDVTTGGNMIYASTYDAHVNVYNMNDYSQVASMTGHKWEVWQVEYCQQGVLFSGSFDHTIKRWDIRNFESTATLKGHK
ncbi:E3 ubiquitin-protein ligase traf7, partial [Nowakowskiella sp. JEL0407]